MRVGVDIVNARLDRVGRATGIELLGRLIRKTPVDTGRAQGNWNASIGDEDGGTSETRRAPVALAEGSARIVGLRLGRGDKLYLTNGLSYIPALNNGHSRQAPAGYVQATVDEMRDFVERLARLENLRG